MEKLLILPSQVTMPNASQTIAETTTDIGQYLGLTGPLLGIVGGLAILIVGYFIAKLLSGLLTKGLRKAGVDKGNTSKTSISAFGGKLLYYLLMIIVLMATLSMMGVSGEVLNPLNNMTSEFFGAIPNIVAAGIIAYIGYFLAKIVAGLVETSGDKIRSFLPKLHLDDLNFDLVKVLKNIVFIFIFIPILIIALEKLDVDVITNPATNMLNIFMGAVPSIIYASIVLLIAVIGGKLIKSILKDLLNSMKVNDLTDKLNLQSVLGKTNLVEIITNLVFVFIIYLGIIEACEILGLSEIVAILHTVIAIVSKIVFGLVILAIGGVVANFATKIFLSGENSNKLLKSIVKGAILMIFMAMGLSVMGIATNIIELAFGLGLGAIAVAFAIAFGLGGKEPAQKEISEFFQKLKKKD